MSGASRRLHERHRSAGGLSRTDAATLPDGEPITNIEPAEAGSKLHTASLRLPCIGDDRGCMACSLESLMPCL
jgi:hypothetical protein